MRQWRTQIRPSLRARRNDRLGRAQDVQEPRQPGPGSGLRAQGVDPSAVRLGLLAGHYRADRSWNEQVLDEATARLHRWRNAADLPAGPDAADLVARVRQYLADDLDTPKALAALDGWTTDALEYGGHDAGGSQTGGERG